MKQWLKRIAMGLLALFTLSVVSLLVFQQISDGPTGPLSGGTFTTGEVMDTPIDDWSVLEGDFEFELVGPGTSRTAGGIMHQGSVYISCDLGFIWARLPSGMTRNILNLIYLFKDWHEAALEDGRVRIRKDGRIYPVSITKVTDPALNENLKLTLERLASEGGFFGPAGMGPRPTDAPNDIWFFKVGHPSP